ncbi:dephospho-CoA kinase [uncultured Imperialibacter sp.]|uniref:dephospho-CoA kinase n=1 Tax=uncultured Imperialibacter sp. TaxID=1672639 RepID=UPI0030DADD08|tara:strand:+ start:185 stop:817 length:633 start_codon:yes stop_codon:yes gene_type:complete
MPTSKPMLVGVTGGIGSGKSTVCKVFEVLGVPVYNSDNRAKALMVEDKRLVEEIKAAFGEEAYPDGQNLNRSFLAKEVFSNPSKLQKLNSLVHPAVGRDFASWVAVQSNQPYVIKEAALLFETGSNNSLDSIVLVTAPEELRVRRVLARDPQRNEKQVRDIIGNQLKDEEKKKLADYVLNNNEQELLVPEVVALHEELLTAAAKKAAKEA